MRSLKPIPACLFLLLALGLARGAAAQEIWTVRSGVTTFYLNPDLMHDLGLRLIDIQETAPFPPEMQYRVEKPHWSFAITTASDFSFQVAHRIAVPYGLLGGAIIHAGNATFEDVASGRGQELRNLEIAYIPSTVEGDGGSHPSDTLVLRDATTHEPLFELRNSMFDFHADDSVLWIHYMNMFITRNLAQKLGRPDLTDWYIGWGEMMAGAQRTGGQDSPGEPPAPVLTGYTDVSLGGLSGITELAHAGTYPTGQIALSMNTTSCNLGTNDVPWLAPMQENHPLIAMALYRLKDGRLEQIGASWLKHGFYALSNSDCTPCQHPSNGTFLGVGCSDTYAVGNNGDRDYLGPRKEVNAFTEAWTCRGSYFAGYQDDCVRRQGGGGLGPLDHRLNALDSDLNLPGATYYYEADYRVRDDVKTDNNIGSRVCTMSWNGNVWVFNTPSTNNPLIEGPTINRWGELHNKAVIDSTDGYYILAVQTTDLGNGQYHYEYALFNRESDLGAHSFSLPVGDANITNIGFHDSDYDPTNDWQVTLQDGTLTWQTDTYENNPNANALVLDLMYNFRFDADRSPADMNATVSMFKPHTPRDLVVATHGPGTESAVRAGRQAAGMRLDPCRPNPLSGSTSIRFSLASARPATVEIFDPQGRRLRTLVDGPVNKGTHEATWDGADEHGRRLASGVYYVRLRSGRDEAVRSVTLVN